MGVDMGAYDPYMMDDGASQFASVDQNMAMLNVAGGIPESCYLSYGSSRGDDEAERNMSKSKRPSSSSGNRAKSARPKSGRPGSARSKTRSKESQEALQGLENKK